MVEWCLLRRADAETRRDQPNAREANVKLRIIIASSHHAKKRRDGGREVSFERKKAACGRFRLRILNRILRAKYNFSRGTSQVESRSIKLFVGFHTTCPRTTEFPPPETGRDGTGRIAACSVLFSGKLSACLI